MKFRSNDSRLESDVEGEVGIGYGEWFELEVGYEVGSGDDRSVNKGINVSKAECVGGFGGSGGWGVLIGVVDGVGFDEIITFRIDHGSDLLCYDGWFDD